MVVFLLGMYEFQLKAFGEVEYNFMEYLISKDMTYNEGVSEFNLVSIYQRNHYSDLHAFVRIRANDFSAA